MTASKIAATCLVALALAGCERPIGGDMTRDHGLDRKPLSALKAGIWVDPNGCDHWIIDDGLEGYMSLRLSPDGKPVCSGAAMPSHATVDFRAGSMLAGGG